MSLIESIQYQAGLIVTGCWKGTSRLKLLKELGWETLAERRNFHRLSLYFKIKANDAPPYLNQYVLQSNPNGTDRYNRTFSPVLLIIGNISLRNAKNINQFKSEFIKIIRPEKNLCWKISD